MKPDGAGQLRWISNCNFFAFKATSNQDQDRTILFEAACSGALRKHLRLMQKLVDSGIEITALHNHLLNESPHVMYMHIHGQGDAVKLATSLHDALALSKTPA